jgi:hypothetical protein
MMDTTTFWGLIESAKQASQDDPDQQVRVLTDALARLPEAEIIAFDSLFRHYLTISYTHELWAAAYILNGGCSDDCFDYFRGWLIAQGETVFQNAMRDPETLADSAEIEAIECESMLYVAQVAYERKTGNPLPRQGRTVLQLTGDVWDEATVNQKYPKLAAKWD